MIQALAYLAQQGRQVLLAGLVLGVLVGLVLPDLAGTLQKLVAPVVVTLLFLAVLRLGPEGVRAGLAGWRAGVLSVLALQLILPCLAVGALFILQVEAIWAFGLVLVLAAAPISGSPNLAIMSGASAPTALRQLVMGTLLLPATALPVFLVMPGLGAPAEVFVIVLRLLAVIGVGPALVEGAHGWGLLLGVLILGFGLQIATLLVAYGRMPDEQAAALGQVAGNRNIAFFIGVLPPALASDLMLFIGLYQIPMYLTPAVMGWVYAHKGLRLG
jgi:ACR3 family arsenite transporter